MEKTAEQNERFAGVKYQLYKKYGEEKDNSVVLLPENILAFNKDHEDLLMAEKEVDTKPFWGELWILLNY